MLSCTFVAQLIKSRSSNASKHKVRGSIPSLATTFFPDNSPILQTL